MLNRTKIKERRLNLGISPKIIADALGLTYNSYYRKEAGTRNFTDDELSVVFSILMVPNKDVGQYFTDTREDRVAADE